MNGAILIEAATDTSWLSKEGIEIAARADVQPESQLTLNVGFKKYVEAIEPKIPHVVVRLKIDFRYTDIFGKDTFGTAYYSALLNRDPLEKQQRASGLPDWGYQIFAVSRPDDWDKLHQQRNQQ